MDYIPAKQILIRNKSTAWFGTDHTVTLYRGCPHGCIYCDSRSDCYRIGDFGRVRAKENALPLLRDCDMHSTQMLHSGDQGTLRKLGLRITMEPKYPGKDLFF